jgi:membrane protease YdiL (CAAX protease family)
MVAVTILSAVVYWVMLPSGTIRGGTGLYIVSIMWSPTIAALIACRLTGQRIDTLGWRWGESRWLWAGYVLPIAYAGIAYALLWAFGLAGFPNPAELEKIRTNFDWPGLPDTATVVAYTVLTMSLALPAAMARAVGEEIGWRGFLTPHVTRVFGFTGGAVITGLVWGVWHCPALLFADYNTGNDPLFSLTCFIVLTVALSIPMAWLRLRSGSLWPAALLHASHNLVIQRVLTPLSTVTSPVTPYALDEFGFAVPSMIAVFAIWFWLRRKQVSATPSPL